MKRFIRRAGILIVVFCIFLAGCGTPMYELTHEEENLIVSYASGTVAKGNRYMTQGLTYPQPEEEEILEEPVVLEPEEDVGESGQPSGNPGDVSPSGEPETAQTATITDALNIAGVTAEYRGYQIMYSYTEGDYAGMSASEGYAYLVMNLALNNVSTQPVECNLWSRNVGLVLYINGEQAADSMMTMMLDDFTTYFDTLEPSSTVDTVAIFEVPEHMIQSIQSLSMDMEVDGVLYQITLE